MYDFLIVKFKNRFKYTFHFKDLISSSAVLISGQIAKIANLHDKK